MKIETSNPHLWPTQRIIDALQKSNGPDSACDIRSLHKLLPIYETLTEGMSDYERAMAVMNGLNKAAKLN